jgi:hypothetical protein
MTTTTRTRTTTLAEQARDIQDAGKSITLDGKLARISGFKLRFGWVRQIDGPVGHEWSWEAIVGTLRGDGKFKS